MKPAWYLTIMLFVLSISACNVFKKSSAAAEQTNVITDRRWKLVELAGKPVPDQVNGKEPFLMLHTAENRYSGSAGCNGIGGNFTLQDNGRIKFSQGMSTKMACENMEIENELTRALIAVDNYTMNGSELSLNKARMAPLARFKAVD